MQTSPSAVEEAARACAERRTVRYWQGDSTLPWEKIFISDLPVWFDLEEVVEIFGAYGTLVSTQAVFLPGKGKHSALLTYGSVEEATWLVENLNKNIPQGMVGTVNIKFACSQDLRGPVHRPYVSQRSRAPG